MRINAQSNLTADDVRDAVNNARKYHGRDIFLQEITEGSRGAITFYCESAHGKFSTGRNDSYGHRAASWTAWGYVIAELFARDPHARIGWYRSAEHFRTVIYEAHDRYLLRQSLGVHSRRSDEYEPGECIEFLELLN